jgi:diguanylate cyclase (GGDEF)-like protein
MSRIGFNRKKARLKRFFGIRARLVVLALIMVGPFMLERVRSLEETRSRQLSNASGELATLAQHAANAQREVISSVEAVLKSAAYIHIHASAAQLGRSCAILRGSLRVDLPWIRSISVVGADGQIQCSTIPDFVGNSLADRAYFKRALEQHEFVLSDFLFSRGAKMPSVIAAYPTTALDAGDQAVMVATINLEWMSQAMASLAGRPGVTTALIDGDGVVLATPPDQKSMIGQPLDVLTRLPSLKDQVGPDSNAPIVVSSGDGSQRTVSLVRIRGTASRLVLSIDESKVSAGINREIRTAYLQLALVCLFVLLGALIAAERLIVQPIGLLTAMAKQFGQGDWSARAARARLPAEFVPLARAFNAMAAQLGQRERELVATNNRLTVIASIDVLSGLANRRGFQSRLEFEWLKTQQTGHDVALLMIDVDHFKLYNDTYGHPEGDACLARIGEVLAAIACETNGFAARYGGEEFCLLLPDVDAATASRVGEMVRAAIEYLLLPHRTSLFQYVTASVGVACASPTEHLKPRDLIEAADAALYAAKHRGRNTVVEHGFIRTTDSNLSLAS